MALTIIFGGGGHARVVLDTLLTTLPCSSLVILDNARRNWGTELFGVPIRGDDSCLAELMSEGAQRFVVAVGSNGPAHLRQTLFQRASDHGLQPHTVIHPRAIGSSRMQVDAGAQLLAGCVVNAAAQVGANVIVNTGAIVEHDCVLEPHAHIAPGAKLCGAVRVGTRAHVGAGAVVRQGITIGADAVVGAGAVVVKDVPPHSVVVGIPARILRKAVA